MWECAGRVRATVPVVSVQGPHGRAGCETGNRIQDRVQVGVSAVGTAKTPTSTRSWPSRARPQLHRWAVRSGGPTRRRSRGGTTVLSRYPRPTAASSAGPQRRQRGPDQVRQRPGRHDEPARRRARRLQPLPQRHPDRRADGGCEDRRIERLGADPLGDRGCQRRLERGGRVHVGGPQRGAGGDQQQRLGARRAVPVHDRVDDGVGEVDVGGSPRDRRRDPGLPLRGDGRDDRLLAAGEVVVVGARGDARPPRRCRRRGRSRAPAPEPAAAPPRAAPPGSPPSSAPAAPSRTQHRRRSCANANLRVRIFWAYRRSACEHEE